MHATISTPTTYFTRDKVDAAAAELAKSDPDWEYRVVNDPKGTGYSFIEIYDEDGEFVHKF
jgi:hypothetical protein